MNLLKLTKYSFNRRAGTGKTHLAIAIASKAIRSEYKARFLMNLANQLEQEKLEGASAN